MEEIDKTNEENLDEQIQKQTNKQIFLTICICIMLIAIIVVLVFKILPAKENSERSDKPVIYLYPTETTEVSVKVGRPENLTCTYPKYENEWKVIANPNGDLIDIKTKRSLYCLYWEGINTVKPTMNEGFIVKGEDTISFLEEKLSILGLNEREANEFIIYWLPKLESNKYNYIRFQTMEQIEENMPLEITPKPDTTIRIVMEYKALEEPIEVKEQILTTPQRIGFTAVEWGGTELK